MGSGSINSPCRDHSHGPGGHLHLRHTDPVAARLQRKHQRSDPPAPARGHRFFGTQLRTVGCFTLQLNMRLDERFDLPLKMMSEVM